LIALGQTRYGFFLNLARAAALVIGVPVGYHIAGVAGLVWAVAISEVPAMLVVYAGFAAEGMLSFKHELRVPAFFTAGYGLGYACLILLQRLGFA
jgi:methylmalonyl-CoA mutase cobalamin-binding subunit